MTPLAARAKGALRAARDRVVGKKTRSVMDELIVRNAERFTVFGAASEFVRFEKVEGDVVELGVFTGISLALLAKAHAFNAVPELPRAVVGFDSFRGLPPDSDGHARWSEGDCATNQAWHPLLPEGAPVTPEATLDLFRACRLPAPRLEVGDFGETVRAAVGRAIAKVAILHVDCDLYEPARTALFALEPALQDGAVVLFDDWFHYRADPNKGEARAFREFLEAFPRWEAIPYRTYATFCNSFILHRRSAA